LDIITEVGLLGVKPVTTPCEDNYRLWSAIGPFLSNPGIYNQLVGRIIYLCFTRPDLAYIVHVLSQFMQNPHSKHSRTALRVVHYLKGHLEQGILFPQENDLQLCEWCDSNWKSCSLTRKSLTGWFI